MFARVTKYKLKPDSIDAATALMEQLKPQIMAMPGFVRFVNAHDETGAGYVVSLIESKAVADSNLEKVNAMWASFAAFMEEPPEPQGYDVIADWS